MAIKVKLSSKQKSLHDFLIPKSGYHYNMSGFTLSFLTQTYSKRSAMILIFVSASVWGVLWIPLRVIESLGLTGLWSNFFFLVLPVIPLTYFFGKAVVKDKPNWPGHCFIGLCIGFGFACYLAGLTLGSVTKTTVLYYLTPAWATLFGLFILKENHSLGRWASILCGLAGCILVVELDLNLVTFDYYDLFGFTSGFIWSLGSVIVRRYENINITAAFLPIYFFGAFITLIFILLFKFEMPSVNVITKTSIPIFLVSILIFFPTFLILLRINQYLSPGLIGILMLSELIVAAISANIFLGEPMSSWQWLGAILIVIAGLTVALLEGKDTKP